MYEIIVRRGEMAVGYQVGDGICQRFLDYVLCGFSECVVEDKNGVQRTSFCELDLGLFGYRYFPPFPGMPIEKNGKSSQSSFYINNFFCFKVLLPIIIA